MKDRGLKRRKNIEAIIQCAHARRCTSEVGGGRIGGINFRYGSIRYAIIDINVEGDVKLYVQPHPNKTAPEDLSGKLNGYIKTHEKYLGVKSFPLTCYGHLNLQVEEIDVDILKGYVNMAVTLIQEHYYKI